MRDTHGGFLADDQESEGDAAGNKRARHFDEPVYDPRTSLPSFPFFPLRKSHAERLPFVWVFFLAGMKKKKAMPLDPSEQEAFQCVGCGAKEFDADYKRWFDVNVCGGCKERDPEKFGLITKSDAKDVSGICFFSCSP
jgi:DNA-repair protein complementing XP-A cells